MFSRNNTNQRGLTLLEMLVVLVAIATVVIILGAVLKPSCNAEENAEREARAHARKLGWDITGVACTDRDTQGDGYISCDVSFKDGRTRALLCGYGAVGGVNGCKTKPVIEDQRQGSDLAEMPE